MYPLRHTTTIPPTHPLQTHTLALSLREARSLQEGTDADTHVVRLQQMELSHSAGDEVAFSVSLTANGTTLWQAEVTLVPHETLVLVPEVEDVEGLEFVVEGAVQSFEYTMRVLTLTAADAEAALSPARAVEYLQQLPMSDTNEHAPTAGSYASQSRGYGGLVMCTNSSSITLTAAHGTVTVVSANLTVYATNTAGLSLTVLCSAGEALLVTAEAPCELSWVREAEGKPSTHSGLGTGALVAIICAAVCLSACAVAAYVLRARLCVGQTNKNVVASEEFLSLNGERVCSLE